MATIERRRLRQALLEKGFKEDTWRKGHRYYRLWDGDKKTHVVMQISEGKANRNLADNNVSLTYKQMHLTKAQLFEFVECTMSGPDYLQVVRRNLEERGRKL